MDPLNILIYSHAGLGGVALLAGSVALSVKKGGPLHKKAGMVFSISMLVSACLASMIAVLPGHQNAFLFAIGIFSIYLISTGFRATRFKVEPKATLLDTGTSWIMLGVAISMLIVPVIMGSGFNIVLGIFGALALGLSIRDLQQYRNAERLKQNWLKLHLIKMTAGYISAVTALITVNQLIPGIYGWLAPTVAGSIFITYWTRKVSKKS